MFRMFKEEPEDSVIYWKSKETGFTTHGSLLTLSAASSGVAYANYEYPFKEHVVVTLTKDQLQRVKEEGNKLLDQFNPFNENNTLRFTG